jgi:hypothetical protein
MRDIVCYYTQRLITAEVDSDEAECVSVNFLVPSFFLKSHRLHGDELRFAMRLNVQKLHSKWANVKPQAALKEIFHWLMLFIPIFQTGIYSGIGTEHIRIFQNGLHEKPIGGGSCRERDATTTIHMHQPPLKFTGPQPYFGCDFCLIQALNNMKNFKAFVPNFLALLPLLSPI